MGILASLWKFVSTLPGAVTAFFGYEKQRDAENNSPAQKANAQAASDEKVSDAITQEVQDNDLSEIQKRASKG